MAFLLFLVLPEITLAAILSILMVAMLIMGSISLPMLITMWLLITLSLRKGRLRPMSVFPWTVMLLTITLPGISLSLMVLLQIMVLFLPLTPIIALFTIIRLIPPE